MSSYSPDVLCLMYETGGIPRNKEIEHRRRDDRYNSKKSAAESTMNGEYFRDLIIRLHESEGRSPLDVCQEIIGELLLQDHGLNEHISYSDAASLLSGSALEDETVFATNVMMYVSARMKLTRATVSDAVTELVGSHLDLFASNTDGKLAAFADFLCPEHMASSSTDEILRKMFEKLMATRSIRRNLRFYLASRILHADCPAVARVIRMIGAPYVRYRAHASSFEFGLIGKDLSGYSPDPSVECIETAWALSDEERQQYIPRMRNGKRSCLRMHDGDVCDRVLVYKARGSEDVPVTYSGRVTHDVPGEGEAKSVVLMQTYTDRSLLIRSRDSDTMIIMLLAMTQRADPASPTSKVYLDMGPVSQVDPTPFIVDIGVLHDRIVADAKKTVPYAFPVETFCLQYLLPGCDYFTNPYSLGPGAFAEGFATLGKMLLGALKRDIQNGIPWILLDEELLWAFVRILYAADFGTAARVKERSGGSVSDASKLAPRTQRALALLSVVSQGLEGQALIEALLAAIPPHETVLAESEAAARQSLSRKRARDGSSVPALEHDVELKTFWSEKMVRAYIRRVHWTINYFNSPSIGVVSDPLAVCDGVSIWGWSIDPSTNHCVTEDEIVSTCDFLRIMEEDGFPMDMSAHGKKI
ncbi:MAG: hypothetical protein AB7P49_00580 [Bdellovibrionales bacterium]